MNDQKTKTVKEIPKEASIGLIMPISLLDGCTQEHWAEVRGIVSEAIDAIDDPKFTKKLVSDADDVGVIQKRIVQNVYSSDVILCDVSGKNPNVMFELGLRLAFDKATVIVKDDKTDYSFDTGIIEHITYPRDLRFSKIVEFQKILSAKILATYKASKKDPNHSPFLKNFGEFQVAKLTQTEISPDRLQIEMLQDMQHEMSRLRRAFDMLYMRRMEDDIPQRRIITMDDGLKGRRILNEDVSQLIMDCIRRYSMEKCQPIDIDNEELINFIEKDISPHRYFGGPEEFKIAVKRLINVYLMNSKEK